MSKQIKLLNNLILGGMALLTFLLPLFFLPVFTDYFELPKQVLLISLTMLIFVAWIVKAAVLKKISWHSTKFDSPVLIFILLLVLGIIFSQNKLQSAITLSSWVPIFGALTFFIVSNNFQANHLLLITQTSLLSATLLSAFSILRYLGVGIISSPVSPVVGKADFSVILQKGFNPFGDLAIASVYLLVCLISGVFILISQRKIKILGVLLLLSVTIIGINLILTSPLTSPVIYKYTKIDYPRPIRLSPNLSWEVAIETFKRLPFFGFGPGLFGEAFTNFKPLGFSQTKYWNLNFNAPYNLWFEILTTKGLIGLLAFGWLVYLGLKSLNITYLCLIFASLLIPFNSVFWFLFFISLGFLTNPQPIKETPSLEHPSSVLNVFACITVLLSLGIYILLGRVLAGDYFLRKSLVAFSQNQGKETYEYQFKALAYNPFNSDYHQLFSQTNMALANSMSLKKDLTDLERQTISQLIQQAVTEARRATELKPQSSANWENLANIYKNLINFAQGADGWAISSYQAAVARNPLDPRLRIDFGGLFYLLGKFDEAKDQFQIATNLKPDYANSFYNLAAALKEKKEFQKAIDALERTLQLVDKDSPDFKKAQEEIEELKKKLPVSQEVQPAGESTLKLPEPLPEPKTEITPVVLPEPEEKTEE